MKIKPALLVATLFLIAPHIYSMPADIGFPFQTISAPSFEAKEGGKEKKPKKEKKTRVKKGGGVTFNDGSAESRGERDKRLMRECKGRSNSGACEGYTRP